MKNQSHKWGIKDEQWSKRFLEGSSNKKEMLKWKVHNPILRMIKMLMRKSEKEKNHHLN